MFQFQNECVLVCMWVGGGWMIPPRKCHDTRVDKWKSKLYRDKQSRLTLQYESAFT